MRLTPIIMESDERKVGEKLVQLKEQKQKRVHIDIVDGLFTDLITITPADLQQFDLSSFEVDFHLLVDDPTEWIEESVALKPQRLIAQIEKMGSQIAYLEAVEGYGVKGGLALELTTPVEELEKQALNKAKVVLLLAIPAGTSGNPFSEAVIPKIKELRKNYDGDILIDGGINPSTYKKIIESGATEAGANSSWWKGVFNETNTF